MFVKGGVTSLMSLFQQEQKSAPVVSPSHTQHSHSYKDQNASDMSLVADSGSPQALEGSDSKDTGQGKEESNGCVPSLRHSEEDSAPPYADFSDTPDF